MQLSGGSGPGDEPDAIPYFRLLTKLGKLTVMQKDPLPVGYDPTVAERGIPFNDLAGEMWNHCGYSSQSSG